MTEKSIETLPVTNENCATCPVHNAANLKKLGLNLKNKDIDKELEVEVLLPQDTETKPKKKIESKSKSKPTKSKVKQIEKVPSYLKHIG